MHDKEMKGEVIIENFLSCLSNPINAKLLLEIKERGQTTASQLLAKFSDVPQATLYRRLQKMLGDGHLKIAGENQIRGTVEKVYALNYDLDAEWNKMGNTNDGRTYMRFVTYHTLGILREFMEYTAKEDINIQKDATGLFIAPVYATNEELTETLNKIIEALTELKDNKPDGERRLRNICITITPPKNE
ncbi:MAG: hypothetical protein FWG31_00885 [Oscillospiraceae bacterium]|nr:hypothetical protein [Oscillospiraceae bacterium]